MECTPTTSVACELSRIADLLSDSTPSALEWAQFWISLTSALGTLVVGALAAYIAYRSHRLSEKALADTADEHARLERRKFLGKLRVTCTRILETGLREPTGTHWKVDKAIVNLASDAAGWNDPLRLALVDEIRALHKQVAALPAEDRSSQIGEAVGKMMGRANLWSRAPEEYTELIRAEASAKRQAESALVQG